MSDRKNVEALRSHLNTIADVDGALSLIGWDQLVMMPPAGTEARSHQMATLARLSHEMLVSDETGTLLEAAEQEVQHDAYESDDASLVRVTRRDWERARKIPVELVEEIELAASQGYETWVAARSNNDFAAFLPALDRNIELKQRYIDLFEYDESPYDVLIEDFEYGLRASEIQSVFDAVRGPVTALIGKLPEDSKAASGGKSVFPIDVQRSTNRKVLETLGFDDNAWRLDETVHPFCEGSGDDIRLTTKYVADDWRTALYSSIHEFGHGLYEFQVADDLQRTQLGTGCSMTLHESQSRLWENMVGRSEAFWTYAGPLMRDAYPDALGQMSDNDLYRASNEMGPSLIRIEADELTYGMHLILRFELERALFEGDLKSVELADAWNAKMKELMNIDVPSDREGILQDVHWSAGSFGYFPTYLLGSILSAQIWDAAAVDLPELKSQVRNGEFGSLRDWLREHVHRYGRKFTPKETIELAVGGPLDPGPYVRYLTDKVDQLYG